MTMIVTVSQAFNEIYNPDTKCQNRAQSNANQIPSSYELIIIYIPMKKTAPCDECRDKRRRCTYDKPCQRCLASNITCTYTNVLTPFDEEYLQRYQLLEQVDLLQKQYHTMEQEITDFRQVTTAARKTSDTLSSTIPASTRDSTQLIQQQQQSWYSPTTGVESNSWSLSFNKSNLIILTNIKTHTELLEYLSAMIEQHKGIPRSLGSAATRGNEGASARMLQTVMWRQYGLSRYKHITHLPHTVTTDTFIPTNLIQQKQEAITSLTWKLLQAYLYCRHLQHLAIHVPSFIDLLVHPDIMQSPAVLALCAVACATPCHHMLHLIPHNYTYYGRFYFNQARALVMEHFDHTSLEIYATYVLMAFYQLLIQQPEESRYYGDMADRMGVILAEQQLQQHTILFQRLQLQLIKVLSPQHLTKHRQLMAGSYKSRRFSKDCHVKAYLLHPTDDDSERETRHILLTIYITQLHKECHQVIHHAPHTGTDYLDILGHMIEMATRRWYLRLPESFRLHSSVLDTFAPAHNGGTTTLLWDQAPDEIPLLTTMTLFNEYLMMAKTHVCESPEDLEARNILATQWRTSGGHVDGEWGESWLARLDRLEHIIQSIPQDGDKVEVVAALLESGYVGFDNLIARTSVTVAIYAVDLLNYLAQHHPCQYDERVTLNAWDILLKATRFGYGDQDIKAAIQVNLQCCLALVRKKSPFSSTIVGYADSMEKDYNVYFSNVV
ncbi:hypothetical protein BC941DRAFT_498793 [Chlamydoabsidia padenii]|nr:hypothetical protein BC941DRAFT_498793 [Chlamydoabsidia padenii]